MFRIDSMLCIINRISVIVAIIVNYIVLFIILVIVCVEWLRHKLKLLRLDIFFIIVLHAVNRHLIILLLPFVIVFMRCLAVNAPAVYGVTAGFIHYYERPIEEVLLLDQYQVFRWLLLLGND